MCCTSGNSSASWNHGDLPLQHHGEPLILSKQSACQTVRRAPVSVHLLGISANISRHFFHPRMRKVMFCSKVSREIEEAPLKRRPQQNKPLWHKLITIVHEERDDVQLSRAGRRVRRVAQTTTHGTQADPHRGKAPRTGEPANIQGARNRWLLSTRGS